MILKEKVYTYLLKNGETSVSGLQKNPDFKNRTYLERILTELRSEGKITKRRKGKFVFYKISENTSTDK